VRARRLPRTSGLGRRRARSDELLVGRRGYVSSFTPNLEAASAKRWVTRSSGVLPVCASPVPLSAEKPRMIAAQQKAARHVDARGRLLPSSAFSTSACQRTIGMTEARIRPVAETSHRLLTEPSGFEVWLARRSSCETLRNLAGTRVTPKATGCGRRCGYFSAAATRGGR